MLVEIATGTSRKTKVWKNKKILWPDLVEKLTNPVKTSETYKEFISASRDEQQQIKDVGGFVGGFLKSGRRKPEAVKRRSLLTLDLDNVPESLDVWGLFQMVYDCEAVIHTTHKNNKKDQRFRLIIPLLRPVEPDEYQAVSRYVADQIGLKYFDNTTFQPERLMFWPSVSSDGDFFSDTQTGDWLDPDEILSKYTDWQDVSSWPTNQTPETHKTQIKKQENPLEKKGLVGSFCRAHGIAEAIETYLPDTYEPVEDSRYTFMGGSSSGGLVVYDDLFAYSHHGTDPASGQLCNAFDLVRLHKFGDTKESFGKMSELALESYAVKKEIAESKLREAKETFSELKKEDEETNTDWTEKLQYSKSGKIEQSAYNLKIIFENDPLINSAFKENEFDNKRYLMTSTPWRKVTEPSPIKNVDLSGLRSYIEIMYGVSANTKIEDALNICFEQNKFHPIKDYLNGVKWDGKKRIDTLLIDYFGAVDNIYTREAIRKMLVGGVARIFEPGCKYDLVLTLSGEQGNGKSTFISKLGQNWFSDSFHTVNGKEAFEQLQGAWIIEIPELSGMRKSEVEPVKHFITKREDTYRPAYGRVIETFKRQCVFFATTNEDDYLRDSSGNRRFMPIVVRDALATKDPLSDDELTPDQVAQIWAEAVQLYRNGEKLYLSDEANKLAKVYQKQHTLSDDRSGLVNQYLEKLLPENWSEMDVYQRRNYISGNDPLSGNGENRRNIVCAYEVWCECFARDRADFDRYKAREVNEIMKNLPGWKPANSTKIFGDYGTQKYYVRT